MRNVKIFNEKDWKEYKPNKARSWNISIEKQLINQ